VSPRKRWCRCKAHRTGEKKATMRIFYDFLARVASSRSVRVASAARSLIGVPKSRRLLTAGHACERCIENTNYSSPRWSTRA
jgi:hypothetical protein